MAEKNIQNKITIDTSEFDRAIKQLTSNLKLTTSEIKLLKSGTEDYTKTVNALEKALSQNQAIAEQMRQKYTEIVKVYGEGSKQAEAYAIKLNNQYTKVNEAKNALEEYKNKTEDTSKAQKDLIDKQYLLTQALYDLAKNALTQATTALVNFTKETINVGSTFETSFANVKKAVSGSTEEMQALEKEIRQTATEKPISADTLASLYQMGGQLGIAREDLKDFTTAMVDLQNTSDLTAESGATMIAQYANVTGLKSEDYSRFASTLSYLGSTTATTESTIMNLVSRISGAGNQIGMTHQQILALSTAMGSVGINAEAGGSAISTIMSNIDIAVDKNNDDLKTWAQTAKMSSTEFANLWKTDVMSALQAVIKGMSDTKAEGGSLNILLSDLGISNIRQLDTMKKLAGASDLLNECVAKANTEWKENQFLTTATADAYNTLESKTLILQNTFKELQISIYDNLKEPLKEAATELTNFLKTDSAKQFATEFSTIVSNMANGAVKSIKFFVTNFDSISKTIKLLIPTVSALVKSFLTIKAIEIGQNVIKSFNALKTAITAAKTAQEGLNATMKANVIGLVTTAVWLLIDGLKALYIWVDSSNRKIREETENLIENKEAIINANAEREKTLSGIDSEYNSYQSLVTELKTLVDENGNVKKGYEDRVNAIIPLLQNATGTEIQLIDNQIIGYKSLMTTLDQVIAKKRMEAKINAYQSDYQDALKQQDETMGQIEEKQKKIQELQDKMTEMEQNGTAGKKSYAYTKNGGVEYFNESQEYRNLKAQKTALTEQLNTLWDTNGENNKTIKKYESLVQEQYEEQLKVDTKAQEEYQKELEKLKSKNNNTTQSNTTVSTTTQPTTTAQTSTTASKTASKTTKEESKTTYQELLNQQKAYKEQLTNYVNEMKNGNNAVTVEMVEDTQSNLSKVESKIKSLQELMGNAVEDITEKANTAATKIIDLEDDEENEISEDDEFDNENHISSGVIFGKGVLGDNAVAVQGGKDAAGAYLDGYLQQQQAQEEALNEAITNRVANEALNYQTATMTPENLAVYDLTERQLAQQKETSQAQGMTDYSYLVTNASTLVMNLAKQAAMQVDFEPIGMYICLGIVRGIQNNKYMVIDAVRSMMEEANESAEDTEEIGSPSKVFYRYGKWIDKGLANGIKDYASDVSNQVKTMALNLQNSVNDLNTNLSSAKINAGATFGNSGTTNINYNFTQTNNSNKSLDTLAIYQESKSMLKRAIRNVYV